MTKDSRTTITISKETYDTISNLSESPVNHSDTQFHPDGTVSVAIPNSALEYLKSIHPDLETAIRAVAFHHQVTFHGDGTVSFPVSDDVLEKLKSLDSDPSTAIRKLIALTAKQQGGGMQVYSPETPQGQEALAKQKLTLEQLHEAIDKFSKVEKTRVATPIGINNHGFFFSDNPRWHPESPDAFKKPIGNIPWVQIHELLGNVPDGTTGDFLKTQGQTH